MGFHENPAPRTGWGHSEHQLPVAKAAMEGAGQRSGGSAPEVTCNSDRRHHSLRSGMNEAGKDKGERQMETMSHPLRKFALKGRTG